MLVAVESEFLRRLREYEAERDCTVNTAASSSSSSSNSSSFDVTVMSQHDVISPSSQRSVSVDSGTPQGELCDTV